MPRRKSIGPEQLLEDGAVLALPAPRVLHKHERHVDEYESPAGAVPQQAITVKAHRLDKRGRKIRENAVLRAEARALATRYNRYLLTLWEARGDREAALAKVFGLSVEEARERAYELHLEVKRGMGATDLGTLLEHFDLGIAERIAILQRHAYSDIPAASLKAVDMVKDLEGDSAGLGSFEDYLRQAKMMGD